MVEKMVMGVDRLLLVSIIEEKTSIDFVKLNFLSLFKPAVVYLHRFTSSLLFPKFYKGNFMYFSYKHVEF